jgi:hypothetical protein
LINKKYLIKEKLKMRDIKLLDNVSRAFYKVGFEVKKHSPAILLGVGVVSVVAGTVMACKATLKVEDVLDEAKDTINDIHAKEELDENANYPEKQIKKELTVAYGKTGLELVKLYGPSVSVFTLGITSILVSYKILHGRNLAISAAYAVVEKGFNDYRARVKERFGERVDHELRYNIKQEVVETLEIDENGNEKRGEKTVDVANIDQPSDHARFFDESSRFWTKSPEYNLMFLKQTQAAATRKLRQRGHLFLNEVYRMLGFDEVAAGQMVGWVYDKDNPIGDNEVDFGIYDVHNAAKRAFVNGYERSILLDFNVDGNVYQLLP